MKNTRFLNLSLLLFIIFCGAACKSAALEAEPQKTGGKTGKVITPAEFKPPKARRIAFKFDGMIADLYARDFAQGNLVYGEFYAAKGQNEKFQLNKIMLDKSELNITEKSWGYRTFFPIATNAAPGERFLIIHYTLNGKNLTASANFAVSATKFPVSKTQLDLGRYSNVATETKPEVIAFKKESTRKKKEAFSSREKDLIGNNLAHPRDMHYLTSPFWTKRIYQNYKINKSGKREYLKESEKVHAGTDFRGVTNTPVFAMADGKVVLADLLYYEGNMVIIDHGNKFFSYYMHMHSIDVKKGDMVKAGATIGKVGSTGMSTAAHLHVSMILNSVHVDPLSLLSLPVRD